MSSEADSCHCGEPVDTTDYRDRGLCSYCDSVRCDAFPGECGRPAPGISMPLDLLRFLRRNAAPRVVDCVEYMSGWNADHQAGVTEHEIRMVRGLADLLAHLLALPYVDDPDYQAAWRV